jgi:hypothetical protein
MIIMMPVGMDRTTGKQGCQMLYLKTKKSIFGQILEDLTLENVDVFYGQREYFTDIWDIL